MLRFFASDTYAWGYRLFIFIGFPAILAFRSELSGAFWAKYLFYMLAFVPVLFILGYMYAKTLIFFTEKIFLGEKEAGRIVVWAVVFSLIIPAAFLYQPIEFALARLVGL